MSNAEIEEQIVRLHKEGKTIREISKVVRKNFTYIGAVLRRRFPDEYVNNDNSKTISKETQALKLFKKEKDLVYVMTKLDMKPEEVKKLYLEFESLQGLPSLKDIHNEIGNSMPSFVQAYKKIYEVVLASIKLSELLKFSTRYRRLKINTMSSARMFRSFFS